MACQSPTPAPGGAHGAPPLGRSSKRRFGAVRQKAGSIFRPRGLSLGCAPHCREAAARRPGKAESRAASGSPCATTPSSMGIRAVEPDFPRLCAAGRGYTHSLSLRFSSSLSPILSEALYSSFLATCRCGSSCGSSDQFGQIESRGFDPGTFLGPMGGGLHTRIPHFPKESECGSFTNPLWGCPST